MFDTIANDLYVETDDFLVSDSAAGTQDHLRLAALPNGGFVAVWQDDTSGVQGRFYDSDGNPVGTQFALGSSADGQPCVTALADGNIVISWSHEITPGNSDVHARIFDASGTAIGNEFTVNPQGGVTGVTALADGGFVVTSEYYNGSSEVLAQVFGADGSKVGNQIIVAYGMTSDSNVTALTGGGFVVTWGDWTDVVGAGGNPGVRAQVFSSMGDKIGGVVALNSVLEGWQIEPSAAALPDGGFVAAWADTQSPSNPAQDGVWFQLFDSSGSRVGSEVHVSSIGTGGIRYPMVKIVPGSGFIVVWPEPDAANSIPHLTGQLYDFTGHPIGTEFSIGGTVPGTHETPDVAVLSGGQIVVGFTNLGASASDLDVRADIIYPLTHGSDSGQVFTGTNHRDFFVGGAGADQIGGGAGADYLNGGAGNDSINGGTGDDTLTGGTGADTLTGGPGNDTFLDTAAGLNGDTITDFAMGDKIVITDANLAGFTFNISGHTLSYTGGSLTLSQVPNGTIVATAAAGGGVQIAVKPDATFVSYEPFDLSALNLNYYYVFATASGLQQGSNTLFNGQTYPDAVEVQATNGAVHTELDFLGSGITVNANGDIASGTVNAIGEVDLTTNALLWYLQGISLSGVALYNALLTPSNTDDLNLFQTALVGNDIITLSPFNDRMSGFSGDDIIDGGAGDDTLTGGPGADTLTGGAGSDTFLDTAAGHNGDTITDFGPEDKIVISDANLLGFTYSLSGTTLTYSGGSLTLSNAPHGHLVAGAAPGGGVQLTLVPLAGHNDFNGDHISDILWRSDSGYLTEWVGTANGGFTSNEVNAGSGAADTSWQVAGTGDFNGDGRIDILWRNAGGYITEWLGTANGGFTSNEVNAGNGSADASWQVAGTGDFNGDGISDILWRNTSGYITEWLGTANGGFTSNQANAGNGSADAGWQVAGTGDFNGDGMSDILWRNASGYVTEWLGTSTGAFVSNQANAGNGSADSSWQVAGTGDFNGDGMTDVLWRNAGGYVTEWLGTANGGFTSNQANAGNGSADASWQVAGTGDFNGDGISDILWRNASSGYVTEWLGTSTGAFISNQANAGTGAADTTWHVQDPFLAA